MLNCLELLGNFVCFVGAICVCAIDLRVFLNQIGLVGNWFEFVVFYTSYWFVS